LREYQLVGFEWLTRLAANISADPGDQMGLGKTVQTLAFLARTNAMALPSSYADIG